MKLILITLNTPYKENFRATSALPYHILYGRSKRVQVEVFSFNLNQLPDERIAEVEQKLSVKIHLVKKPKWVGWVIKWHLSFIRTFLKYPIFCYFKVKDKEAKEIKSREPDAIWIYGEELMRVTKQFSEYKRIHTFPDCESMYYYRMLGRRFVFSHKSSFWRNAIMYPKYLQMERDMDTNVPCHVVGEEDARFLRNLNPSLKTYFIRHPHYEIAEPQKVIHFANPKIKLLIAGRYDFYMKEQADEMVEALTKAQQFTLRENYHITFLGKGWEDHTKKLKEAGYEVEHIAFAPDYVEEVRKHDIQITPIAIGTGTKGKVLDAIVNGLLVIGTNYALENIAVEDGVSCLEYETQEELLAFLSDIPRNREHYEQMAEQGRQNVLRLHNREKVAEELFGLLK